MTLDTSIKVLAEKLASVGGTGTNLYLTKVTAYDSGTRMATCTNDDGASTFPVQVVAASDPVVDGGLWVAEFGLGKQLGVFPQPAAKAGGGGGGAPILFNMPGVIGVGSAAEIPIGSGTLTLVSAEARLKTATNAGNIVLEITGYDGTNKALTLTINSNNKYATASWAGGTTLTGGSTSYITARVVSVPNFAVNNQPTDLIITVKTTSS